MTKALWICGDSNSVGVANALTPGGGTVATWLQLNRPDVVPRNLARGGEGSAAGIARVEPMLAEAVPAMAVICWGGADLLQIVAAADVVRWETWAGRPPTPTDETIDTVATRLVAFGRQLLARGTRAYVARGIGAQTVPLDGRYQDVTLWNSYTDAQREALLSVLRDFETGYKMLADRVAALGPDVPQLTWGSPPQRLGYHTDGTNPALWLDGIHGTVATYRDLACRVVVNLERDAAW